MVLRLAWTPVEQARRLLEASELRRFTAATLTAVDSLMGRMSTIRDLGYSVTRAEVDDDVLGVAAPIRGDQARVVAAVGVAAVANRVGSDMEREIVERVRDAAREIGDRLAVVAG